MTGQIQILNRLRSYLVEEKKPEPITKPKTPNDVVSAIQTIITDAQRFSESEASAFAMLGRRASIGEPQAITELVEQLKVLIEQHNLGLEGVSNDDMALDVYKRAWGLGPVHDLYLEPDIYELRIDHPGLVSVSRHGRNEIVSGISFADNQEVDDLVRQLVTAHSQHDLFDESNPYVQVVLPLAGGTRLTAYRPPLSEHTSVVFRKLAAFKMSREALTANGTVNERLHDLIVMLHRYGGRSLFLGPQESGKTSWMVHLIDYLPEAVRTVVIGRDRELRLAHIYPDRDIVELEEHPRIRGGTLEDLVAGWMKCSPELTIFEEFRLDEIEAAVIAGERSRYIWATAHYGSAKDAVLGGTSLLMRKSSLPYEAAQQQFLRAFDTFVVLYGDMVRGIKKVVGVYVAWHNGRNVEFRTLAEWRGSEDDYWEGEWVFPEQPFPVHLERMRRFGVTQSELAKVGWR